MAMRHRLIFKPLTRLELEQAIAWYEQQRPGLGKELQSELALVLEQIRTKPERFPKVTARARKARLRRFPFSVYFTSASESIGVLAIFHAKRDPEVLRRRLP